MIKFILKQLNKIKFFPYYFVITIPYGIGTACEYALAASLSKENKKTIVIISCNYFQKILKYKYYVSYLNYGVLFNNKTLNIFLKNSFVVTPKFLIHKMAIRKVTSIYLGRKPNRRKKIGKIY